MSNKNIFKKKEFYDEKLSAKEVPPNQKGQLMKHQKIISRFLSSNTIYDSLLLVHTMGSGKTCSAIGAIEQIKNESNNFKGVYVFAKGVGLLDNFVKELRDKLLSDMDETQIKDLFRKYNNLVKLTKTGDL